jgi:hypothetical protein
LFTLFTISTWLNWGNCNYSCMNMYLVLLDSCYFFLILSFIFCVINIKYVTLYLCAELLYSYYWVGLPWHKCFFISMRLIYYLAYHVYVRRYIFHQSFKFQSFIAEISWRPKAHEDNILYSVYVENYYIITSCYNLVSF